MKQNIAYYLRDACCYFVPERTLH